MPEQTLISNVSDTARWVAAYRAWESTRPDALFKDPYAARLAGDTGRIFAAKQVRARWPIVIRTRLMDDFITASISEGCDRVLNLGGGCSTSRPPPFCG
jgi:O-methyltransferase involved in polyketide biosynthesis